MAQTLGFQYGRLGRGAQGIRNTWDLDASSDELLKNNPLDQWSKFTSSLTNAAAALGTELMPSATQALDNLTVTVRALAKLFAGDFSWDTFKGAILGAGQPSDGGWFDKAQGWVYDHGLSNLWSRSGGGSPTLSGGRIGPGGIGPSGLGPGSGGAGGGALGASNRGVGGWWTDERMQHAADRLVKEAGLSPMGAAALVARWAGVEASGGPTSSNNIGGGHWGIAQWDRARGGPAMASASYDDQLTHAIGELNGSERAAGDALRSAKTMAEGAIGASRYEKAEHYNSATGIDNSTANTPVGSVYRKLYGGGDSAAKSPPVPGTKSPWGKPVGDDSVFDSDSTDPSQKAHAKELHIHVTSILDGKKVAQSTQRHIVRRNQYVYGPSGFDGSAMPSGVDHGMAPAV